VTYFSKVTCKEAVFCQFDFIIKWDRSYKDSNTPVGAMGFVGTTIKASSLDLSSSEGKGQGYSLGFSVLRPINMTKIYH
jgi:hypothetical protein